MDKKNVLTRLQQLVGSLKPAAGSDIKDLKGLHHKLAEQFLKDPDVIISGNRLHHEGAAKLEPGIEAHDPFSHLDDLFERAPSIDKTIVPSLIFRRETAFRNNFLGNSVPDWGTGMAVAESYGPFIDEHGRPVWFDFFQSVEMVRIFIKGRTAPVLLVPVWGTITAKTSYKIEPGSVWIASDLIAQTSALQGFYTGLKVRGGSLELSVLAETSHGQIFINPGVNATLQLDLRQNEATAPSKDAGFDATEAEIQLPKSLTLEFDTLHSKLTAGNASCTVFGCDLEFQVAKQPPAWIALFGQILIPYTVKAVGEVHDVFQVKTSDSTLCTVSNGAKIGDASGWLLPAAKVDPAQLGEAAGTGSLCVGLRQGISAQWKGLHGRTQLKHPAIVTEPGMITVIDFFAENTYGRQKWVLWRNAESKHHSEVVLGFGPSFPFVYVTASKGSEAVVFFCKHKASFDRPVDANGSPLKIESTIALAGIFQTGKSFHAVLTDNDLLFDGNPNKAETYKRYSIALRNALFNTSAPYSLFLTGELRGDDQITKGIAALMFGVYLYLPTLPDPYVASYTAPSRDVAAAGFASLRVALAGFVKWLDPSPAGQANEAANDPAYVFFKFLPLNQSLVSANVSAATVSPAMAQATAVRAVRTFQTGVRTFNQNLASVVTTEQLPLPLASTQAQPDIFKPTAADVNVREQINRAVQTGDLRTAVGGLEANPLLAHIKDKTQQVEQILNVAVRNAEGTAGFVGAAVAGAETPAMTTMMAKSNHRGDLFARDTFMLLDVSSNADQMGVSFGTAFQVDRDDRGETTLRLADASFSIGAPVSGDFLLQIINMDVVASSRNVRAVTLPHISWEPVANIPLAIEGLPDPQDLITVAPGLLVYDNDGIPTRIYSESPYPVPVAPLPVTHHFLKEFNNPNVPRQLHSTFTLPFALIVQAEFQRSTKLPPDKNSRVHFNMPWFDQLHGGLQIKALAPAAPSPSKRPSFGGWTIQLDNNIKWFLFGIPITGSTLGNVVKTIFNNEFYSNKPKVPLEKIELSGYGATMFSNWLDSDAAIAEVSQAKFDVLVGRTAHEVIQVRSVLYPFGVHVVRTITLMRSPNGYVFRSDSGWKAESDGFYDFDYKINFDTGPLIPVNDPYEFHPGVVKGISNVREIKDYPAGGMFTSSFKLNDPDQPLPVQNLTLADWQKLFKSVTSLNDALSVEMQAVVFDADVHVDHVSSGGVKDAAYGDFKVQSRKMLGYVQLAPSAVLVPAHVFAELLTLQNGSLGGPVDCIIDVASSRQKMRLSRVDVNPALDSSGKNIFVGAARGSLILPPDGSWSTVKHQTDTGDVKPVEEGHSVPLIKANGGGNFRIANPVDVVQVASNINYGVLQSTGTQKLLFDIPQFTGGVQKLFSDETYFADAYNLLNSKGVFPNIANALGLTNAEKEVQILGEGLMKLADRTLDLNSLLPPNFQYAFINEPGVLKIYAEYKSTDGAGGKLKLGIDSAAVLADKWKAALSNIRVVVDLGPFDHLMWVDGHLNASSGVKTAYDIPHLQFGPVLKPVVEILQVLAQLSGDDFDKGMDVSMSNAPDNWEYKFNCAKEIPVIKFPSPEELAIDPNPPLKLEAGLKVGFYFNEVISIQTDLKQLVPACGAYVEFFGGLHVQCFTLAVASVYAVGQVTLGIAGDTKAGISVHMKFGFGVEVVVGLPVVANVSVLYMVEVEASISQSSFTIGALMLFRGSADICGGLVSICIQIEAGGAIEGNSADPTKGPTYCIAQVTFTIDVCVLWVIDIEESDTWQEKRQIA